MINPQWLKLPLSRTNIHGPKDVRAIEVGLYAHKHLYVLLFLWLKTKGIKNLRIMRVTSIRQVILIICTFITLIFYSILRIFLILYVFIIIITVFLIFNIIIIITIKLFDLKSKHQKILNCRTVYLFAQMLLVPAWMVQHKEKYTTLLYV